MAAFDWTSFEDALFRAALNVACSTMDKHPHAFYAVVFDEFYAETGDVIALPRLALNSEEALQGNEDARWSSADWKWKLLSIGTKEVNQLHRSLQKEASSLDDDERWDKLHDRFIQAFARVAKSLYRQLKSHPRVHKNFGVFVFPNDNEIAVLRQCTTPAQFKKLFPHLLEKLDHEETLARSSPQDQLAAYQADIREYDKEILALGAEAIPFLLNVLNDREQAWAAVDLLGELGIPDERVISKLRKRDQNGDELRCHETMALAMLGDVAFLQQLAGHQKTREVAVRGLCSHYTAWGSQGRRKFRLDYRPMEQVLDVPECRKLVKDLYGGPEISSEDLDEALRGLESSHAVIRGHALCALGNRKLGKTAAEQILPAIALRLRDRNANVRRLAVLNLSYWKKAAKPYLAEVRKLFKDPSELVRSYARNCAKEIR